MTKENLFTNWGDFSEATRNVLLAARCEIAIFDHDLSRLGLENPEINDAFRHLLRSSAHHRIRIAVQQSDRIEREFPRLRETHRLFAHNLFITVVPAHLANLRDTLILADGTAAVVRFEREQPRGKHLAGDREACRPYLRRFDEIWAEGGTPLAATTLGL